MTTKKLVIVIVSVLVALGLLVVIFAGAIIGLAFYSIGKSEAAETAKTFLKSNEKLKQEIGNVKDFGMFVTGSVNSNNTDGEATLHLKVIGERRTVNATVSLTYKSNRAWRVTDASFENDAGKNVELLEQYEQGEPPPPSPPPREHDH
ncbi:MAG: hypothetical protein H7Y30_00195 [Pyrinomonadaceae bacterium]|nr:hypothetical protein [Pyrinomonadaceae bacterium]